MFHDYVKIYVKGGDGGNGMVAFRREKYIPMGGPAGGDGGRGGNVVAVGNPMLTTLTDFKYRRHYKAEKGVNGMAKNMHGANGEDLLLQTPLGTVVKDEHGQILADITLPGQKVILAKGGRGGRGNSRFANAHDKAPRYAENGEPGQEKWLIFELKLIADVGLVGFPNAGKSTLLSRVSAATPKIADYPFTTLNPNLGVVRFDDHSDLVIADLPGLIEGAASGIGLGHRFLRHAERNRILVHVLDMSGLTEKEPWENLAAIEEELRLYKNDFLQRPAVIAANKMDMPDAAEKLKELQKRVDGKYPIFPISALTGQGIPQLLSALRQTLSQLPPLETEPAREEMLTTVVRDEQPFSILRDDNGIWQVSGERIEKLVKMTDLNNEDAVLRMQRIFVKMGLEDALREAGVQVGDTVNIAGNSFDYTE
ncbi:MAG: GTPase ObgE [Firmicutes bacterium]|nr:GTPase ObgE [Bacillota bacterium]